MIVERGDLDPAGDQLRHDRVHLGIGENDIPHHHHLAFAVGHEGEPGTESERGLQRHAVEHHMQVAARQADAIDPARHFRARLADRRSEEHTSELQSLMRISYAVFCLKKKKYNQQPNQYNKRLTSSHELKCANPSTTTIK